MLSISLILYARILQLFLLTGLKRTDLINEYFRHFNKPSNVIMVYSNPKKNHILKKIKNFNKVFNNVHKDKFINEQNCTGQNVKIAWRVIRLMIKKILLLKRLKNYG